MFSIVAILALIVGVICAKGKPGEGVNAKSTLWSLPIGGEIALAMKSVGVRVMWATTCVCVAGAHCKSLEGEPGVLV